MFAFLFVLIVALALPAYAEEVQEEPVPAAASLDQSLLELYSDPVEEKEPDVWEGKEPEIKMTRSDEDIRITVRPNPAMNDEEMLSIQLVKLESEDGDFLGLKTFVPEDQAREAEFLVNPDVLMIDSVKITVTNTAQESWVQVAPLKVEEPVIVPPPPVETPAEVSTLAPEEPKEKKRSKRWLIW